MCAPLKSIEAECPMPNGIKRMYTDESKWRIDSSLEHFVSEDLTVINPPNGRNYQFNYAKIDEYYVLGTSDSSRWDIIDAQGNYVLSFSLSIYPNRSIATKAALDYTYPWDKSACTKENTFVHNEKGMMYYFHWETQTPVFQKAIEQGFPDRVTKDGILMKLVWHPGAEDMTFIRQKRLLLSIVSMVQSGKEQTSHYKTINKILQGKEEDFKLKTIPTYRMNQDISCYHGNPGEVFPDMMKGDEVFVDPKKMWNRPSLTWLSQFQPGLVQPDAWWNVRGDYVTIKMPATKNRSSFRCVIYVVHATSENCALRFLVNCAYDALRFMETSNSNTLLTKPSEWKSFAKKFRTNPHLVGEYDLALKPQLDATGSLIPNVEESCICFIRNNTAVSVAADRPDVSVLWIAKKIDEELIAAGKGEPPTWTPPKKRTPVSASRQQAADVPSMH